MWWGKGGGGGGGDGGGRSRDYGEVQLSRSGVRDQEHLVVTDTEAAVTSK